MLCKVNMTKLQFLYYVLKIFVYPDRVDDVGRAHLRDHGHDVDHGGALAAETRRHQLYVPLVAHL